MKEIWRWDRNHMSAIEGRRSFVSNQILKSWQLLRIVRKFPSFFRNMRDWILWGAGFTTPLISNVHPHITLPSIPRSIKSANVLRFSRLNFVTLFLYACYMWILTYYADLSHTKSYRTTQNGTKSYKIIQNKHKIIQNHTKSYKTIQNHTKPYRTTQNRTKSHITTQNHTKS